VNNVNNKLVMIWKNVTRYLIRRVLVCVCVCMCVCAHVKQLIKTIRDLLEQPHFELSAGPHTSNTGAWVLTLALWHWELHCLGSYAVSSGNLLLIRHQ